MTVRVERVVDLPAPPEDVWQFIADPGKRADAISVVSSYELGEDDTATWQIDLPIPLLDRTAAVETRDTDRKPPEYVRFVGRSKVMRVVGEHRLHRTEQGTRLVNSFVVEGRLPGVEKYFKRNMDAELDNLERALQADLGLEA